MKIEQTNAFKIDIEHLAKIAQEYQYTSCTGYRGMPGERAKGIEEYEKKARDIWAWENKMPYKEKREAVEKMLKEFCLKNGGRTYD